MPHGHSEAAGSASRLCRVASHRLHTHTLTHTHTRLHIHTARRPAARGGRGLHMPHALPCLPASLPPRWHGPRARRIHNTHTRLRAQANSVSSLVGSRGLADITHYGWSLSPLALPAAAPRACMPLAGAISSMCPPSPSCPTFMCLAPTRWPPSLSACACGAHAHVRVRALASVGCARRGANPTQAPLPAAATVTRNPLARKNQLVAPASNGPKVKMRHRGRTSWVGRPPNHRTACVRAE